MADQCNEKDKIAHNDPSQLDTDISAQQFSDADCEKHDDVHQSSTDAPRLERRLKSRHLQMIAIGASVQHTTIQSIQNMLTVYRRSGWNWSFYQQWRCTC
jgi:amino acid permease